MSAFSQFGYPATSLPSQLLVNNAAPSTVSTSCCESGRPIMTDPATGQTVCSCQYDSARLLSTYPRMAAGLPVYGSPYADQTGYVPTFSTDPSAFYSPLGYDASTCYPYDPTKTGYPYAASYGGMEFNGGMPRKNATREATSTLKAWLHEHIKNPYPTKGEKIMLAIITKMTLTQVSTWFANARRRLKKENKMTWSPRYQAGGDEKNDSDNDDGDSNNNTSANGERTQLNDSLGGSESDSGNDDKGTAVKLGKSGKDTVLSNIGGQQRHSNHLLTNLNLSHSSPPPGSVSSISGDSISASESLTSPRENSSCSMPTTSSTRVHSGNSISSHVDNSMKPKIWSLAHTATSESPPIMRRTPPPSQHGLSPGSLGSPVNSLQQWMNGMFHNSHPTINRYQMMTGMNTTSPPAGTNRLSAPTGALSMYGNTSNNLQRLGLPTSSSLEGAGPVGGLGGGSSLSAPLSSGTSQSLQTERTHLQNDVMSAQSLNQMSSLRDLRVPSSSSSSYTLNQRLDSIPDPS